MDPETLKNIIMVLVPMVLSLSVHEWAHAWTAYQFGDDTAAQQGRLTLNPISHIDPIGTLLLPIILVLSGSSLFFGWARPVPVNPTKFNRNISMKKGMLWTAAAGPIANLILAVLMAIALKIMSSTGFEDEAIQQLVWTMFVLNIVLAVFNLLPVPPLDGNRVLVGLLPNRAEAAYYRFLQKNPYVMPMAFIVVIMAGGKIISWPIRKIAQLILTVTGNV
jgi:Zn-dependent protease